MHRYYRLSALYPSLIVIVSYSIWYYYENKDYDSEWLTSDAVTTMSIMYAMLYSIVVSIACLPLYLVRANIIQKSASLTLLTWFAVPVTLMSYFIFHEIRVSLTYDTELGRTLIDVTMLNLPFALGIIGSYLIYQKKNYL